VTVLSPSDIAPAPIRTALRPIGTARYVTLSWRQIDVLRELLKDGGSNAEIGKRLCLSEDTVKTHFKSVFRKAGGNRVSVIIDIMRGRTVILDPRGDRVGF
jgi:DNA-binding NarL/FixJ family response regulator